MCSQSALVLALGVQESWPIGQDQFPFRSALPIQDMKIHSTKRQGGTNLQDEYSNIGGSHGIAYLKSPIDAPILLAQL